MISQSPGPRFKKRAQHPKEGDPQIYWDVTFSDPKHHIHRMTPGSLGTLSNQLHQQVQLALALPCFLPLEKEGGARPGGEEPLGVEYKMPTGRRSV